MSVLDGFRVPWYDQITAVVYRAYRSDGALLYVGYTRHLKKRLAGHKRTAMWWSEAERFEIEPEIGVALAQLLERHQIIRLAPLRNKVANFRRGWDYERRGTAGTGLTYCPERDEFRHSGEAVPA